MQQRTLGPDGLRVSTIGLGCWGMSGSYGPADEVEAIATLNLALDIGVTFLDTADSYGDGHNESLLGRALAGRRHEFVLATKTGFVKRTGDDGSTRIAVDGRPERIKAACEASLRRLQTDVIDLYYLHRADPAVPIEDSVGALAELVDAGKVRFLGLSEVSAETLQRAHAVHPIAALQSEYSLWTREPEITVWPVCHSLGISFVPFSPLGRGFLTATMTDPARMAADDWRATNPRFTTENLARNTKLLEPLITVARSRGASPVQVALAWILSQGDSIVPIPGTKRRRNLVENAGAVEIALTPEDLECLDAAFPIGAAAGDRYNPEQSHWVGQ